MTLPDTTSGRRAQLLHDLDRHILCLDGATGTWLQGQDLGPSDFGGEEFEGCNENLVLTRPDLILDLHRAYLAAGADIIETNTFGATPLVLAEYPPLETKAYEINRRAAELARQAAAEFDTERLHYVAGSIGPTTKAISVTGGVTFLELIETFEAQAAALLDGGVDYLLLETCQDTRNIKAALCAIDNLSKSRDEHIPIAVSGTIEPMGTMLAGQSAEALAVSVAHIDLLYIGLNCATGPEFMTDHIRALSQLSTARVACVPNAGLPDEEGDYLETPEMVAGIVGRFVDEGWINLVGGCCGTTESHITALADIAAKGVPRPLPSHHRALYSGIDWVESTPDNRPLLVGERTNVIGSRRFKRLISEGAWESAAEVGRAQVRKGAQIVDVCLADPDRDEVDDTDAFLSELIKKVKAPLMIDSTDVEVVHRALTYCQGKAIINSINLEDGEERFEEIVPLAKRFGAALVVGCIDEDPIQGMAVTAERKLDVARRSIDLLCRKYGMAQEDLIFDPLVFPCATGDQAYLGSAQATVEGVRAIKEAFPQVRTILGISNVSFGLPPAGREVMNSVFLYECTRAGLDMAIVNTEKLERYASIDPVERSLAERVLFETSDKTVAEFTAHFRDASSRIVKDPSTLTLDERLTNYIVEGSKEGLREDLDRKLAESAPLDIVNGPLMAGMDEVGRLFNGNELIVAEVLQSAEAMKAAVDYLEPHMEKSASSTRGTIVLATVKGDVHDIGKNLVEIILGNNGYDIVNLGIKVPPQDIIKAVREHQPDILGLSGLLVKSAQMMVVTAKDMSAAGVTPDILVGGAALSRSFTRRKIATSYDGEVIYARDAMSGLALANRLVAETERNGLIEELRVEDRRLEEAGKQTRAPQKRVNTQVAVTPLSTLPAPPDYKAHRLEDIPVDEIWRWINPRMLFGKHLGLKGDFESKLKAGDPAAQKIHAALEPIQSEARQGRMRLRAQWRWFPAVGEDNTLRIWRNASDMEPISWTLPRARGGGIGLPDFVAGADPAGQPKDSVALFVVSAGEGIREWAEELKEAGAYLQSHVLQALALESAEALAEWLHSRLRGHWGFPDVPGATMLSRFKAKYQGRRYSPGYPACPDLSLQRDLWTLLEPESIGVELTEGDMMDPEASVSALVLHHPEARYFAAEEEE